MRIRHWLGLALLLSLIGLGAGADAQSVQLTKCTAHITSATTTTLTNCAATANVSYSIYYLSACLANGGVSTTVTIQDSGGANLIGTGQTYALPNVGACLWSGPYRGFRYWNATALGAGLQIVTNAAGPVDVYVEVSR